MQKLKPLKPKTRVSPSVGEFVCSESESVPAFKQHLVKDTLGANLTCTGQTERHV